MWPVVGRIELFNSNFNVYEHDFHKIRRMCILLVEHIDCLHLSITVAQSIIRCYQNVIRSIQQEKKMLGAILESCEHQCHNCYALVACVPLPEALAADPAGGGHLLVVHDALAYPHRPVGIPLLLQKKYFVYYLYYTYVHKVYYFW